MAEELARESVEVEPEGLQKLASLMDDNGDLPPHSSADDPEPQAQKTESEVEQPVEQAKSDEDQTAEVDYEGAKYRVPAQLKDAFLRQADYTRKTQEVAQSKAAVEQERQTVQRLMQEAQQFVGQYAAIQQIDSQLQQFAKVDWQKLAAEDPLQNLQLRQSWTELVQGRQEALRQLEQARMQNYAQQAQAAHKAVQEGNAILAKEIPNWGPEVQKALLDVAQTVGYKPEELASVTDPRAIRILDLARDGLKFREQSKVVEKQVRQAPPKVVRPQATQPAEHSPPRNEHLQRLRKTGRDEDALAALKQLGIN